MKKVSLRSVLGESNVTDSYFTIEEVPFNTIQYEDIAFCVSNSALEYKQHLLSKGVVSTINTNYLWQYNDAVLCARLDFIDFKKGFELEDLIGKSFTSFCGSCSDAYIFTFIEGEDIIFKKEIQQLVQTISKRPTVFNTPDISELPTNPIFTESKLDCYSAKFGIENFRECVNANELVKKIITMLQQREGTGITEHNAFFFCKDSILYIADCRKSSRAYWPIFYDFNIMKPTLIADYTGPDIEVGERYDTELVHVYLKYPDGTVEEIEEENKKYISFPYNTTIGKPGPNIFTVYYESARAQYTVIGKYTFVGLNAVYTGDPLYIGQSVDKDFVNVIVSYVTENMYIPKDKWEIISKNIVTYQHIQNGIAVFWIRAYPSYNDDKPALCKLLVQVAVVDPDPIEFEAHYHGIQHAVETSFKDGTPVAVGSSFEKSAIHAHVITSQKEWIDIPPSDIMISDTIVRKPGRNIYTATYRYKDKVFTDKFEIFGYENKFSRDRKFILYKITDEGEEDVTEEYEESFLLTSGITELQGNENYKQYYFSVDIFNSVLDNNSRYRLIAPKDCGLGYKYATEWYINKKNNNTRMRLIKVFTEGE